MAFEREWRDLAYLPRWSIVRTLRPQSVAEHSYYVTLYAMQIADLIEWDNDKASLMKHALAHDAPEIEMGDLPSFTKRKLGDMRLEELEDKILAFKFPEAKDWNNYTENEHAIVSAADHMDAVMYLCEEIQLGNKTLGSFDEPRQLFHATWDHQSHGLPTCSILHRNMHKLCVAWKKLPRVSVNPLLDNLNTWMTVVLPEVDRAYRGVSRRMF